MRINLTTPMSDDKERQRRTKAEIDAIEKYTEERMNDEYGKIHTDGSRSGGQPTVATQKAHTMVREVLAEWEIEPSSTTPAQLLIATTEALCRAIDQQEALRQPTQSDALQADALDFGNELIFACAGLRHEPIDTEATFSITWDGFPYDVTICAAKGQSK